MKKDVYRELPAGYRLFLDLRLAEDRKQLKILLIAQLAATFVLAAAGLLCCPLRHAFDMETREMIIGLGTMSIGLFGYILAHEWVHGMAIRFITGRQAKFGFELSKGMAYAGSDAYFGKVPYIIIALAPLLFWGTALFIILYEVPDKWFWYLYVIQMMNISGSVGDLYVTYLMMKAPKDTVVRDYGTSMMFYEPTRELI